MARTDGEASSSPLSTEIVFAATVLVPCFRGLDDIARLVNDMTTWTQHHSDNDRRHGLRHVTHRSMVAMSRQSCRAMSLLYERKEETVRILFVSGTVSFR